MHKLSGFLSEGDFCLQIIIHTLHPIEQTREIALLLLQKKDKKIKWSS